MIRTLILTALRQIFRQPFRTLLVLQGVIWGTALGIFPPALIQGSFKKAERDATTTGIDRILVTLERRNSNESYTWKDIEWLRNTYGKDIRHIAGYGVGTIADQSGYSLITTDTNAISSRALQMIRGRFFSNAELVAGASVCVLDQKLADRLFEGRNPIGQSYQAGVLDLEVIGVAASAGEADLDEFGYDNTHMMSRFIKGLQRNIGALQSGPAKQLSGGENVMIPRSLIPELNPSVFEIRADPKRILDLRDRLRSDLIAAGYQPVIYTNAILPFLYRQTLDTFVELNRVVFLLCVVVGTCVVCVLMVLSVVERQREIAIRRVEGARRWHIGLQFVVETGTICGVGGILGVPLGIALAAFRVWLEPLGAVAWAFPPIESVVMVLLVTLIGLVGGLLPAWRAIQLDPVEVLRYE